MDKKYINPDNPVYISYAWANSEHPNIEEDVKHLCEILEVHHIYYKQDKINLCPYRWSIQKAEEEIGEGTAIIVVISERYLKSLHCMNEWHLMRENGKIWERVFPVVLEDAKVTNDDIFDKYRVFFEERKQYIIDKQLKDSPLKKVEVKATESNFFIDDLKHVYQYLANYNCGNLSKLRENNYAIIINQLKEFLQQKNGSIIIHKPITKEDIDKNTKKVFPFYIPEGLLQRDLEADNLYNGIKNNRFFKLVGVGGSGKTSLAYLMMQRHQSDFNEIAFVTINNNIKEDFVEQLNKSLKLKFKDEEVRYQHIVSYLEDNFNSAQPNLLVLDINNETSDGTKDFIKNINKNCPKNWKVLTILREDIDVSKIMEEENLNKKQDIVFLKDLFLKRAGERYKDFKDFNKLFKTILYNPLLAEQLGFYLLNLPELKSLDAINKILKADTFKNRDMKGYAVLTNDNRSTVLNFLTNLVSYNSFDQNEQKLLRHFILWQADFIDYKVIKELLKNVFDSDDDLADTLSNLSDRAILMTKLSEDGSYSYELHGMLADSLRIQVDYSNHDFSKYLDNIEEIIEYGYYDFMPFADCIGNSLCKNITKNYDLLNGMGTKFSHTWKFDYAKVLYDNAIKIVSKEVDNNPNCEKYKQSLASTYNNLANLQQVNLDEYDSAKKNYQKAITIREQLPKNNPEYQNELARVYNNLANLQQINLNDYNSAIKNYQKAIEIRENLPTDNPEYKNELARVYCMLSILLQKDHFKDYGSAKDYYQKAIEIGELLPKDNPEYQNLLATSYSLFADFQKDPLKDYGTAKDYYQKAIEIREHLPKDNPEYQNGLAWLYNNLAVLQKDPLKDYGAAKDYYLKAIEIGELLPKDNPEYQNLLATSYSLFADFQKDPLKDYGAAKDNYQKAIEIREHLPKDNPEYQNLLANAYSFFASLQIKQFKDYESAKENYKKAIEIREQLPKDNPEYQNLLAWLYNNLAVLQKDPLKDYGAAKDNYQKAIEIREQLPKDNPKYLDLLAWLYNNLAGLQKDHLKDYESAKDNYQKAIEIKEQLPKDSPKYQDYLAKAYYNFAVFQKEHLKNYEVAKENCNKAIEIAKLLSIIKSEKYFIKLINYKYFLFKICFDNNEIESAKSILEEIKPLAEECLAENPDDEWTIKVNNWIKDLWEKINK